MSGNLEKDESASDSVKDLQAQLRDFVVRRDWEKFHSPKNLMIALMGEVGELAEHFQWVTPDELISLKNQPEALQAIGQEIADVLSYLLRLADVLGIDVGKAFQNKIKINEAKYPVTLSKGNAKKYDKLKND